MPSDGREPWKYSPDPAAAPAGKAPGGGLLGRRGEGAEGEVLLGREGTKGVLNSFLAFS